jgi:hypothetical protein
MGLDVKIVYKGITMSDKLSLEHVIRNIATGNFTPSDQPKITLEHAIKKVVRKESSFGAKDSKPIDEDVGGLVGSGTGGEGKLHAESSKKKVKEDEEDSKLPGSEDKMDEAVGHMGTDKFQGNQFKSVRTSTPHIRPPGKSTEGSESQAPENVSRQRSLAKEKSSMTLQGKVNEGVKTKVVDFLSHLRTAPTHNVPAVVTKSGLPAAAGSKEVATVTKKSTLPTTTTPATKTAVAPKAKVAPETKTEVKPETKTTTTTGVKTDTPTKTETPTKSSTTTPVVAPTVTTTPATEPKVAAPTNTKPMVAIPPIPPAGTNPPTPAKPKAFSFKGPKLGVPHDANFDILDYVPVKVKTHFAKKETRYASMKEENERRSIENVPRKDAGDRKELEYVGRKNTKQKTLARNASIKNVIDEGRNLAKVVKKVVKETGAGKDDLTDGKTRVYDNPPIIINPPEKIVDLNVAEGVIGKLAKSAIGTTAATTAASGAAGAAAAKYYGGDAKDVKQTAIDTAKSVFTDPYEKFKKGDYKGAAWDVATTATPPGAAAEVGGLLSKGAEYLARQTKVGQEVGKAIGKIPGASTAADYMRKAGETLGVREPKEPLKSEKPLAPGEGIKLEPKAKVKPLAQGEPIKLK